MQVKLFVNEAHVFNDAVIMFDVWPPSWKILQNAGRHDSAHFGEFCAATMMDGTMQGSGACTAGKPYNTNVSSTAAGESDALMVPVSKGLLLMQKVWDEVLASAFADLDTQLD